MFDVPAAHPTIIEILEDWPKRAQPLHVEHHVEAIERDHEQIHDESSKSMKT
jgi:hypothetical protein